MALTHSTAIRNGFADDVDAAINGGGGAGNLVIMTSGDAALATIVLAATAFDAAGAAGGNAAGVMELDAAGTTDETSASVGTAALFKFEDNANVEIFRGVVAVAGEDMDISSVSIPAGATVSITSFSYTAAP